MSEIGIEPTVHYNAFGPISHRAPSPNRRAPSPDRRARCNCCPYGYHIDLGFVEFCDRVSRENKKPGERKTETKERRRQRQSMDVLLGLESPVFWNIQQLLPAVPDELPKDDVPTIRPVPPVRKSSLIPYENDELCQAVQDFEATLERTKRRRSQQFTPEISETIETEAFHAQSSELTEEPVTSNVTQCKITKAAPLKNIREQMALSLERMKELESKVQEIPPLERTIERLEKEVLDLYKQLSDLTNQLKSEKEKLKNIHEKQPKKKILNDVGVSCSVMTREIGISPVISKKTSNFTETERIHAREQCIQTDQIYEDKNNRISLRNMDKVSESIPCFKESKGVQVSIFEPFLKIIDKRDCSTQVTPTKSVEKRDCSIQVNSTKVVDKRDCSVQVTPTKTVDKRDFSTQITPLAKVTRDTGVNAKTKTCDVATEIKISARECGVSDDKITDLVCDKCRSISTKSIGIGIGNVKEPTPSSLLVGLGNRSKSFDITKKHTRNIGTSTIPPVKKLTATKQVGTVDVMVLKKHVGVNTCGVRLRDSCTDADEVDSRDIEVTRKVEEVTRKVEDKHDRTDNKDTKDLKSKIPRPTGSTTPVMNRKKLLRQDTYNKTLPIVVMAEEKRGSTSPDKPETLQEEQVTVTLRKKPPKTLDLTVAETERRFSTELSLSENRKSSFDRFSGLFDDCGYDYDEQYGDQESNRNSQMFPENAMFQPISDKFRKKLVPSKEMKAAMKVVNDGLHKYPNGLPKNLKTASSIIQQEWFKISSTASANPLDVEDYLDSFEEVSSTLLEFVVNMVDNNGNTAMHYAVSHGNFDVVSILLDSKVCNINKANAAGYTCVMLVSLAQVRSDTHRQVIKRLFLLADVNVRAKQHGQTALMLAVSHGRLDMVQLLLDAGADPNIQDFDGSTALMCAAEHDHLDIVKHILAHPDCDPSIVDCDGSSALAIAMEAGHRDIGVLLYAREHFAPNSRGSSPYASLKHRRSRPSSSPKPKTPTSPAPTKRTESTP